MPKRNLVTVALILFTTLTSIRILPASCGYYEKTVDVMAITDEEFNFEFPHGWERYLGWGLYIEDAFTHFESVYGINMVLRGWWDTWDSTDSEVQLPVLLQEALAECGGFFNTTLGEWEWRPRDVSIPGFGTYHIDLVIVFTGQAVLGDGVSPSEWRSLIIEGWYPLAPRTQLLMHEITHQYYVSHCSNDCVMNPNQFFIPKHWCSVCQSVVIANEQRFWRWINTGGGGGALCPTLFIWNGTDYAEEVLLDIHAESDITVQHKIQNALVLKNAIYSLQLRELDNFTSHIDQVKLYAVDDDGEPHACPLFYARHENIYATLRLLFDDEIRVDLTPTQIVALRFLPSIPNGEVDFFLFEINGYNTKTMK